MQCAVACWTGNYDVPKRGRLVPARRERIQMVNIETGFCELTVAFECLQPADHAPQAVSLQGGTPHIRVPFTFRPLN